jgi:hypothetical protein
VRDVSRDVAEGNDMMRGTRVWVDGKKSDSWNDTTNEKNLVCNVHGSLNRKNILIYIQQDAKLHSLFYLETALHVTISVSNRCDLIYIFISYIFSHPTCFGPS